MVKIALLLLTDKMIEQANCFYNEPELEVVHTAVVHRDNLPDHIRIAEERDAEIIVSRGGVPPMAREITPIPVIDIKLTGQEIALLLHRAMEQVGKPHPFIGVTSAVSSVGDMSYFEEVLGIRVRHYPINGLVDIHPMVQQAIGDKVDIIIAGQNASLYCEKIGFPHMSFEGTEDCMRETLLQVKNTAYAIELKKKNVAYLETILNYSFNGIIEMNREGIITRVNHVAAKIMGKSDEAMVGSDFHSVVGAEEAESFLAAIAEGRELYANITNINGTTVVMNLAPVVVDGAVQQIILSFHEMRKLARMEAEARREQYLRRHVAAGNFDLLVKQSKSMRKAVKTARTYAHSTAPVLLRGEAGTEQEMFAQGIHNSSQYANGPFVTLDCDGALGVSYISLHVSDGEATQLYMVQQLADAARRADYGTLYLTDIDLLSKAAQHTLLHLITDRMIFPADGSYPEPASVRVIAACQRDLRPLVQQGAFRQDLYYQLSALSIPVPPLRQRREDLETLIGQYMKNHFTSYSRNLSLSGQALNRLVEYDWPGNLDQLYGFLECMLVNANAQIIKEGYVADLLDKLYPQEEMGGGEHPVVIYQHPEAEVIRGLLAKHMGDRGKVAQELGVSKSTLWRRMKKYGIMA